MIKNVELPICPHCGKNLSFFEAWLIHKEGEYKCPDCEQTVSVTYNKKLVKYAIIAIAIDVLIMAVSLLLGEISLFVLILSFFPFIIFYLLVPYSVILKEKDVRIKEDDMEDYYSDRDVKTYKIKKTYEDLNTIYEDPLDFDDIEKTKVF